MNIQAVEESEARFEAYVQAVTSVIGHKDRALAALPNSGCSQRLDERFKSTLSGQWGLFNERQLGPRTEPCRLPPHVLSKRRAPAARQ
jgi:hypothetical protein